MDDMLRGFLETGKLAFLEQQMTLERVLELIPDLVFQREAATDFQIYEAGDLTLAVSNGRVDSIALYFQDSEPAFPAQLRMRIGDGEGEFPRQEKEFLDYLYNNKLLLSPHFNFLGEQIGVKLKSGVVILFDEGKLYSIRKSSIDD